MTTNTTDQAQTQDQPQPQTQTQTVSSSGAGGGVRRGWGDSVVFRTVAPVVTGLLVIVAWQVVTQAAGVSATVLPSPLRVWDAAVQNRDVLWANTLPTLKVTGAGLGATLVTSAVIATALAFVPLLRNATLPLLVVAQSIPIIVLAPLFVIWFGFGLGPKIGLIVISSTLPMAVSLLQGLLSADPDAATLMKSLGAGRIKVFWRLQVPSSLPYFFTGLRVIASFAVLAAVFAETVGAESGLGIYMVIEKNMLRTDLVLAAAVITIVIGLTLFSLTYLLEALTMPWERRRRAMRSE